MDDKMDSEHSYSGDSSTSTESSSGSSEGDEEVMEPVHLLGLTLELPQQLCEDYTLFKEFFSMKTWESLEDNHKEQLKKLLPNFTENEEEETETTIKMLFSHEPFHFTSPLSNFFNNLRQGNYRPDIAKMRKFLMKARAKQQRHKIKSYYAKLLPEVLISRERLLAAIKSAPPGPAPKLPGLPLTLSEKNTYTRPLYMRVRQRYFEELTAIRSEMGGDESEDDNYPEGPPDQFIRKKKQGSSSQKVDNNISGTLGAMDPSHPTSLECLKNVLAAHRSRRQYRENHPELNTTGISIDDIKQRVSLVNGAKKLMFGGSKADLPNQKIRKGPKKDVSGKQVNKAKKGKEDPQDSIEGLIPNIKIKCEPEESDSESSLLDPVTSPMSGKKPMEHIEIKQEVVDKCPPTVTNALFNDPKLDCVIKQEPEDTPPPATNTSKTKQPVPIRLEELDGIDMMALPVEIADDSGEVAGGSAEAALTQTTHACFLSLVRALFPAPAAHRASKKQLRARCAAALASPIAPLNTWYTQSDDWCAELDSALDFLAGERGPHPDEFVPYLQFIPETQMYQWIGAGRDCDAILGRLCERWLRTASPPPNTAEAPPPKYPTSWVVRAPTNSEIADFRAQERKRFASAAKPFTYVQHGYRAAVGPCLRGGVGAASSALLAAARPRHATFAALLRDALARLPNGEGTRHDVLTLLKMSQWVGQCSDQALLVALSSALDRLHAAKRDPLVKYDQRTAVWTYMHRHRSEEDWAKLCGARRGPKPRPPPPSPPRMEVEPYPAEEPPEASDSDVDVEETGAAPTSALLLRGPPTPTPTVPTPPTPAPPPPAKQKGKRVSTPTPKPKPAPKQPQPKQTPPKQTPPKPPAKANAAKQPALMSHSVKQASLMAQSVKQATLMSQAAKQNLTHLKQTLVPTPKTSQPSPKAATQPKQTNATTKQTTPKANVQAKVVGAAKQVQSPANNAVPSASTSQVKTTIIQTLPVQVAKSMPSVVVPPQKSPLIKQRPLQKTEVAPPPHSQGCISSSISQQIVPTPTVVQTPTAVSIQNKVAQVTRSLLIRPPAVHTVQTTAAPLVSTTIQSQVTPTSRRGVVRVLSPATPSSGKSLISPRALMQQNTSTAKKRTAVTSTVAVPFPAQSTGSVTTVVSSTGTGVAGTRTVQLGGRTVQLANQTVHLPGGQAVQLTAGHTLQLSSLQLPTHSVRLPSGQTVQLASPQTVRVSTTAVKNPSPRTHQSSPTIKNVQTSSTVQIPVSTMQIAGQTVQIAGQTVQLAGQSVQLTGHTVKLPSGQSVQVASQSVLPSQSVQLPTGQTVQLGGNVQTIQLGGTNVQIPSGQSVHLGGQTVQLGGQTVQLAGGQTVQLPGGQTLQLSSGQTVQLPSGQTLQLAGQTMQLSNQTPKSLAQVIRAQATGDKSAVQPIVAKLLTNAQGQMVSVEGRAGAAGAAGAVRAVRVLPPTARLARPLLLTSGKPLHNIILQQSDGSIRVTSSGMAGSTQTLVLGNIGAQANTSTTSAPVLKLQQVNQIQQVKLAQGIKIQQQSVSTAGATTTGVRSVVMDGQQLKLVGGRHVLARILRPAHPQ